MYGKMMDSLSEQMKPFADMTTIGTQAFEKLLKKHMDLAGDCFEAGLGQASQFTSSKDLPALMSAQSAFMTDMGKKLFDLAKYDMEVVAEANQAVAGVIENSLKSMPGWNAKPKPKAA
ncbi:phasin family protein [Immundisolibacter sp.]|uniref:phasin family protein n=1 Tax=Immundisolibacter sp. TaxID=1934948 RepID=UPI00356582BD